MTPKRRQVEPDVCVVLIGHELSADDVAGIISGHRLQRVYVSKRTFYERQGYSFTRHPPVPGDRYGCPWCVVGFVRLHRGEAVQLRARHRRARTRRRTSTS